LDDFPAVTAKFPKLSCRIWLKFLLKIVDPTNKLYVAQLEMT